MGSQMKVPPGDVKMRATERMRADGKDISSRLGTALIIFLINYLQKEDLH